ncbi:MAG: stage 0 sporulation family protein [Bacillales bacterium]|nr:stage 0 sporulation family protein [Bacillales bacterium]
MFNVVGVRFKKAGKIYYFDPEGLHIEKEDLVIVETTRGIEHGIAVIPQKTVEENDVVLPLKKVIRVATNKDRLIIAENNEIEKQAFVMCLEKVKEHNLEMNLVDVEFSFDKSKVVFFFTAEGRVDFRELVKDLALVFKTRIELRQIGVRDEAKMLGGIGPCGRMLCCSTFLGDFEPVSIKMAKDQNLSLNPTKISGICGRLMCCLKYENDDYESIKDIMPDVGRIIKTPLGKGEVIGLNILERIMKISLKEQEKVVEYTLDELIEEGLLPIATARK